VMRSIVRPERDASSRGCSKHKTKQDKTERETN
jgi:hypothetical protein